MDNFRVLETEQGELLAFGGSSKKINFQKHDYSIFFMRIDSDYKVVVAKDIELDKRFYDDLGQSLKGFFRYMLDIGQHHFYDNKLFFTVEHNYTQCGQSDVTDSYRCIFCNQTVVAIQFDLDGNQDWMHKIQKQNFVGIKNLGHDYKFINGIHHIYYMTHVKNYSQANPKKTIKLTAHANNQNRVLVRVRISSEGKVEKDLIYNAKSPAMYASPSNLNVLSDSGKIISCVYSEEQKRVVPCIVTDL